MTSALVAQPMAKKKTAARADVEIAKIRASVLRDARIVVAVTGEGLSEYLSRVLEVAVAKDKAEALAREQKPKR